MSVKHHDVAGTLHEKPRAQCGDSRPPVDLVIALLDGFSRVDRFGAHAAAEGHSRDDGPSEEIRAHEVESETDHKEILEGEPRTDLTSDHLLPSALPTLSVASHSVDENPRISRGSRMGPPGLEPGTK